MIYTNTAFKNQTKKVNYVDITLRNGTVLNLEPFDLTLGQFTMKDETSTGKFTVGSANAKTMSLTIANHTDKFSMYDFYKSIIYIYVAVELEDGTILKERKGKYYVIEPSTTGEVINISGIDSMYLFDKNYNAKTVYPATLQEILSDCCLDCGVSIGFKQFDNYNFVVDKKPLDCTYREVVSWVAQIAGYNARISNDDKLELVWHETMSEDTLNGGSFQLYNEENSYDGGDFTTYTDAILWDGGNFTDPAPNTITRIKNLKLSTDDVVITGVKIKNSENEYLFGEDSYCVTLQDNYLLTGKETEVAQYLGRKLIGLQFRPLTCEIPNNPLYESFDSCYVYDRKGNSYYALINSVSYSINGFTTISCKAESPLRNESSYISESAKAVVKAKRETADMLTTYDKAVQNMNMLASNAMGLYRDMEMQTDNSIIYYMSNKPITKNESGKCEFVTNSVVYKMTGEGFFVSEDGGKTYVSGFDSNGNAVVNVLSAIGITFDWAKGGTITLGGDNNTNGSMNVLDANGNIIGKFNKEGLWAKNGYFEGTIKSENAEITGGYINIETDSLDYSAIKLSYGKDKLSITPHSITLGHTSNVILSSDTLLIGNATSGIYTSLRMAEIIVKNGSSMVSITPTNLSISYSKLTVASTSTFDCSATANFNGTVKFNTLSNVTFYGDMNVNGDFIVSSVGSFTVPRKAEFSGNVDVSGIFQTKGTTKLCGGTYDTLGFFGGTGSYKQTVSTITLPSSATAYENATKINEVINALKKYNLL